MRRIAMLMLLLCLAAPARAQSITSFAPDTTSRAVKARTPPDAIDLPIWLGIQFAPLAGVTSELEGLERTDAQNCTPWAGVGLTWPWVQSRQTWIDAGYQHWEFAGKSFLRFAPVGDRVEPVALDEFSLRGGVDQLFWQPNRLSAAVGLGVGAGSGWVQDRSLAESNVFLSAELVAHALVYFKLNPRVRIALGASGSWAYAAGGDAVNGGWEHLEVVFRLENNLRVPKRFVAGP